VKRVLPNPSLERTSTGRALGPRGGVRSAQTLGSAARHALEPSASIEPGALRSQKLGRRAQRGGWGGRGDFGPLRQFGPQAHRHRCCHAPEHTGCSGGSSRSRGRHRRSHRIRRVRRTENPIQSLPPAPLARSVTNSLPNSSLERTSTGKPLGPRGSHAYHPPRGPSAFPAGSAQLKR
jgi:hypothetical protein